MAQANMQENNPSPSIDDEDPTACVSQSQWQVKVSWPQMMEDNRRVHGTVLVSSTKPHQASVNPNCFQCSTLVVLGGEINSTKSGRSKEQTNSVQLLEIPTDPSDFPKWRDGPPMNRPRSRFDAVVCNGAVYAIGGRNVTIFERIEIYDLLDESTANLAQKWCNLSCQLSRMSRYGNATVLQDRYIVVIASRGHDLHIDLQHSVDIMDTSNHTLVTICAPQESVPRCRRPRYRLSTAAIGNKVYIVSGHQRVSAPKSVEYIEFDIPESSPDQIHPKILSWNEEQDILVTVPRQDYMSVAVGSKIVVYGGSCRRLEVIDLERRRVSALPDMSEAKCGQYMVFQPDSGELLAMYSEKMEALQFGSSQVKKELEHEIYYAQESPTSGVKRPPHDCHQITDAKTLKRSKEASEESGSTPVTLDTVSIDSSTDQTFIPNSENRESSSDQKVVYDTDSDAKRGLIILEHLKRLDASRQDQEKRLKALEQEKQVLEQIVTERTRRLEDQSTKHQQQTLEQIKGMQEQFLAQFEQKFMSRFDTMGQNVQELNRQGLSSLGANDAQNTAAAIVTPDNGSGNASGERIVDGQGLLNRGAKDTQNVATSIVHRDNGSREQVVVYWNNPKGRIRISKDGP